MSIPTQRNSTVILNNQHDWTAWYNQLKSRCVAYKIWDHVKEVNNLPFLPEPGMPLMPLISAYAVPQGNPPALRPSDLTANALKGFKEDMEYHRAMKDDYKSLLHKYETQERSVQHITQLIQATVVPHLQRVCCLPDQSLHQWLTSLKLTAGTDDRIKKERSRNRYFTSLNPMRNANNWDLWLHEYDHATTEAEANHVSDVSDIDNITKDFVVAVNKIAPMWATNFLDTGRMQVDMTRKEMMKRFREHMMLSHPLKSVNKKQAFFAGADEDSSFLTADGATIQGTQKDASAATERAPFKQRNPKGKGKAVKRALEHEGGKKCLACDGLHELKTCFYLNPKDAPEWFKPSPLVQELVRLRREHEPSVQAALRGQSRSRSSTPHFTKSHSSTPQVQEVEENNQ
jgi:hypothetical protein